MGFFRQSQDESPNNTTQNGKTGAYTYENAVSKACLFLVHGKVA